MRKRNYELLQLSRDVQLIENVKYFKFFLYIIS